MCLQLLTVLSGLTPMRHERREEPHTSQNLNKDHWTLPPPTHHQALPPPAHHQTLPPPTHYQALHGVALHLNVNNFIEDPSLGKFY